MVKVIVVLRLGLGFWVVLGLVLGLGVGLGVVVGVELRLDRGRVVVGLVGYG